MPFVRHGSSAQLPAVRFFLRRACAPDQGLAPVDGVIFPQGMPFELLVHQDPFDARAVAEADAEHVPDLSL
jgi:hypothetical protein